MKRQPIVSLAHAGQAVAAVALGAAALDQLTKWVPSLVGSTTYHNPGLSLGLVGGSAGWLTGLMVSTFAVAAAFALRWVCSGRVSAVAVGLVAGGAASNAFDRWVFGSVRDVVPVGPVVVNLADVFVVVGVAFVAWSLRRGPRRSGLARRPSTRSATSTPGQEGLAEHTT